MTTIASQKEVLLESNHKMESLQSELTDQGHRVEGLEAERVRLETYINELNLALEEKGKEHEQQLQMKTFEVSENCYIQYYSPLLMRPFISTSKM
jgi:septal ring factor EnvC (AmiA/AmiB activator)